MSAAGSFRSMTFITFVDRGGVALFYGAAL